MTDEETPGLGRRGFLKATGAAGTAAALANLSGAREGDGRTPGSGDNGTGSQGEEAAVELTVGVSQPAEFEDLRASLPDDAEVLRVDEDLLYMHVRLPERGSAYRRLQEQSRIASQDGVKFTEPNEEIQFVKMSAGRERQADTDDPRFDRQYAPDQVEAPGAWEAVEDADEEVTIAIVDTGVDYEHPDLADQFGSYKGRDETGVLWMEDEDPSPDDPEEYHGTHVAGIAAGRRDNGEGIAGIAGLDNVNLLSYRVLNESGTGTPVGISEGIKKAAKDGADVINMSLGAPFHVFLMRRAISFAIDEGALPIAAAGNDSADLSSGYYPAGFDDCMAVSALTRSETLASFSNYGDEVDVGAPGVGIHSSLPREYSGGYGNLNGTSMACPVVAGVAALVKLEYPDLAPADVRRRIKNNADDVGLDEEEQGDGQVNALKAVTAGTGGGGEADAVFEGSIDLQYDTRNFSYNPESTDLDRIVVDLEGPDEGDFDLYLTLDGREASETDFDRRDRSIGSGSRIEIEGDQVDGSTELNICVHAYRGSGSFTVTVTEQDWNPSLEVDPAVEPGRPLSFSAGDLPGTARWTFDGRTVEGSVVTHAFDQAGEYPVELTLDRGGESVTAQASLTVSPDARGGHFHRGDAVEGRIDGETTAFRYDPQLGATDQMTLALDSPGRAPADLELYVTTDGRAPSVDDYDLEATTAAAPGRVLLEGVEGPIGVLVRHVAGDRTFRLETDELGSRI